MAAGDPRRAARVAEVLAAVVTTGPRDTWPTALVQQCRLAVDSAGAGLSLSDATGPVGVAAATPGLARLGEDLQFGLGEGPCLDAARTGRVVRVPDLAGDDRWPQYAREAVAAGMRAEFCVPLVVGALRIGVLNVYQDATGPLSEPSWATVRVYAEAATAVLLLARQDGADAEQPGAAVEAVDLRPVVHQAAGIVAVQLDVDPATALLRLRAHAFADAQPLRDLAADVVARRVAFDHSHAGVARRSTPVGRPPAPGPDISKEEG